MQQLHCTPATSQPRQNNSQELLVFLCFQPGDKFANLHQVYEIFFATTGALPKPQIAN
jgi:hypothetical protein